ncbi:hypothetical protein QAD02_001673 [Eretmocerus hayati]|uniref:Uncharacterized protein n=1 Tax=Eretmocerus hayati TaxID=131215 RepID=A0ACC2NJB4_9HYME|nr:hypothetical protein QAD02_001673 [Eretmocerus hayati]
MLRRAFIVPWLMTSIIQATTETKLISDYYKYRGVQQIVIFGCWSDVENLEMFRKVSSLDMELTIQPIFDEMNLKDSLRVNYYKIGVVLDLECPKRDTVLNQVINVVKGEWMPFNESYVWLMLMKNRQSLMMMPLESLLADLPLSIDADLVAALPSDRYDESPDDVDGHGVMGNFSEFELFDVYNPSYRHGGRINVTRMGSWDQERGIIDELLRDYKYKRRGNLHGLPLNFSIALNFAPKSADLDDYLSVPVNKHLDTMHRYNYALLLQLRDYYNFTINLSFSDSWGYLVNGTFNGIVGDMIKGIVDIGATPFQFKPERLDVMDYTVQIYKAESMIIFRHPKRQEMNNSLLEPFTKQVWYLTIIVGLLNWLLLYFTVKSEIQFGKYTNNGNSLSAEPASETFLITSGALCQQGLSDTPRIFSGRIVFLSIFFWALMLYQFYSASIVGSLLAEKPRFIKTLKDLTESNLDVGATDVGYNHDFFRTTSYKEAIDLFNRKIKSNKKRKQSSYFSSEEGMRKVKKGGFAFQVDLEGAYKIMSETFNEDEMCDIQGIDLLGMKHTATCTSKHSPFKKMVTYGLRQIVEHGTAQRLNTIWKTKKPQCPESHNSTPTPVTFVDFSPAIIMICAATALSISIMLIENLVRNYDGLRIPSLWRDKKTSASESMHEGSEPDILDES